jgi:hypothetical protein
MSTELSAFGNPHSARSVTIEGKNAACVTGLGKPFASCSGRRNLLVAKADYSATVKTFP